MAKRNPLSIPARKRKKRRPYEKILSFLYDYEIMSDEPTKEGASLRTFGKKMTFPDKVIKNPFQKSRWLGLRKKV